MAPTQRENSDSIEALAAKYDALLDRQKEFEDKEDERYKNLNTKLDAISKQLIGTIGEADTAEAPRSFLARLISLEKFKASVDLWLARFVIPVMIAQTLSIIAFVGGVLTHTIHVSFGP